MIAPRALLRLALAGALLAPATVACSGGGMKTTKNASSKKQHKSDARALLAQAREDAKTGETDSADKAYEEAYELDKQFDVLEEHVDFLIHAGRASRALSTAKAYYDANAADPKGYKLYAETLLANNKGTDALEIADQIVALDADDPAGHEKKGRALLLLEKNEEGLEELRKAVSLDGDSATYHMSLGTALHKLGKVDEAALEFRAALKRAPEEATARVLLGMALRDQGEFDEAKGFLEQALEIDPRNGRAYFELGILYNKQNKQADAETAFAKAVKLSPNESLFWYAYGEIFRVQSRTSDAIAAYQKAVDLDPPFPKALTKLGTLLVDEKKWEAAEVVLTSAIRREPKNHANYFQMAIVMTKQKKRSQAVENYKRYLDLAPKNDVDRTRARDAINDLQRR
ncbi:MAG: tetratricopeptide repeat protein [Deltaproteobacteria bacterium]|nr:tetratricopeptide repeat protein [Deltaproteobacteria bacterium]